MAYVYAKANAVAARHIDVYNGINRENTKVEVKARVNLAQTEHTPRKTPKGYFPAEIETARSGVDAYTILHAPNAMALEFGHQPSGWFAGTDTHPPDGEYILTRAALGGV